MTSPRITEKDVEQLVDGMPSIWAKAENLAFYGNKRRLRAIANASKGRIISGNDGYRLTSKATPEEIRHCVNRLRHQARQMEFRANEIENQSTPKLIIKSKLW